MYWNFILNRLQLSRSRSFVPVLRFAVKLLEKGSFDFYRKLNASWYIIVNIGHLQVGWTLISFQN